MKILLEVIISVIFHPVAAILSWINILGRSDLRPFQKAVWIVVCTIWGIGPLLYISVGGGTLW